MTEEYKCGDNRFEIIKKAKADILDKTNIDSSPEEMAVLDNILFRFWQMGWLKKYDEPQLPANLDEAAEKSANKYYYDNGCSPFQNTEIAAFADGFKAGAQWMAEQGYSQKTYVYANRLNDENEAVIQLGWGEPERGGFKPGDKVIVQIRKADRL